MQRRLSSLALAAFLLVGLTGCQQIRTNQAEIIELSNKVNHDLDLLKKQNTFLNRKVNKLQDSVEEASTVSKALREELSTYANRPDEVKLEIIEEVNSRFQAIGQSNEAFKAEVTEMFTTQAQNVNNRLDTTLAQMEKTLNNHTAFVQFVAAEQDSINRVFANRFDSRPWYQSIIGKWEDRERASNEDGGELEND